MGSCTVKSTIDPMEQRVEWLPPVPPAPIPPVEPEASQPSRLRRALGPLAVVGAVAIKFAGSPKALLLLLPKLKLLTTSASMLVSIAAYALIWGWPFAAGFVLLLLVHEMGHVIQLRREGIEASAPMFIPFLGAVVAAKSLGENATAEARVGLAGPVLGSLGAELLVPVWLLTDNDFWGALAFTGFFLNLFNLIPIGFLDGGAIARAMGEAWRMPVIHFEGGVPMRALEPDRSRAVLIATLYVGLAVLLIYGMTRTHVPQHRL